MRRSNLILGTLLLLVTNAIALYLAAQNRTGGPVQSIELTERELALQNQGQENSGVSLRLRWHRQEEAAYFGREKLEAVGFDFRVPEGSAGKDLLFPQRVVYATLEYGGAAWEQWFQQAEKPPARPSREPQSSATRLFPVDISRDFAELRRRYPDQSKFLIVTAIVQARIQDIADAKTGTLLRDQCVGSVVGILPSEFNVPLPFARLLAPLSPEPAGEPRFTVTLAYGRNLEPWITSVKTK